MASPTRPRSHRHPPRPASRRRPAAAPSVAANARTSPAVDPGPGRTGAPLTDRPRHGQPAATPADTQTAAAVRQEAACPQPPRCLARHATGRQLREIVALPAAGGVTLVVDRDAGTQSDPRLLAELAPDEPSGNAELVARLYLQTPRRCRLLRAAAPLTDDDTDTDTDPRRVPKAVKGADGTRYLLTCWPDGVGEVRWVADPPGRRSPRVCTVRDVVAGLEAYQPVLAMTRAAISDSAARTRCLAGELTVVLRSPRVLNCGLRAAVLAEVARGASYSEIAVRCGRVRHDRGGAAVGETTWLKRRVGLTPEAGTRHCSVWVDADVLALIARDGLGLAPHEVEVA